MRYFLSHRPSVIYLNLPTLGVWLIPTNSLCGMTNINSLSQSFIESVAGFVAGVASTLVSHPLDVIKTRLQSK